MNRVSSNVSHTFPLSRLFQLSLIIIVSLLLSSCQSETSTISTAEKQVEINADELLTTLGEAYLYGYPLVLMDLTKQAVTNVVEPHPTFASAPINQLGHYQTFPDHTMKRVVKPNVDTYYSTAWLDLAKEPILFTMPGTDRYYLIPLIDAYSNVFASPGTRTNGTADQQLLIAGPDWEGTVPDGYTLIKAPTEMVWLLGRVQVNSPEDGATVVKSIQESMDLRPLSALGKSDYTPPKGVVNANYEDMIPVKAIQTLSTKDYFNRLTTLMAQNAPPKADLDFIKKVEEIGLIAGKEFDLSSDNFILNTKMKVLPKFIHQKFEEQRMNPDTNTLANGWTFPINGIGIYGTDYIRRAYIDYVGLGANIPEDAVYMTCTFDVNGHRLDASKSYQLHFDASEIPPVHAFWSLTAYNADDFLIKNDFNRFALGDRDALRYNTDGSLDLYFQTNPPTADKMSNWLPIPEEGRFSLTLRLYWPKEPALNGNWQPPFLYPMEIVL